jgi:phosphoglycolate phosphatase
MNPPLLYGKNTTKKYKAVIFDIDGTILDTRVGIVEAVKYTIDALQLNMLSEDQLNTFVGPPIQTSFITKYALSETEVQNAAYIFREYYKNISLLKAKPYDGIYDAMNKLKKQGFKIGIATYKRQDYAIKLLEHFRFDCYCESICGADDKNKLTKLDIIKNCLLDLGIRDKAQAVMVGDSEYDAIGAAEAGIDFIGVTWGFGFRTTEDVMRYRNVGCVNSMEVLRKILIDI